MSVYYLCVCTLGDQKRLSNPLELELQEVVSYLVWVLGIELGSFEKLGHALNP